MSCEHLRGGVVAIREDPEQQMLASDSVVPKPLRLLNMKRHLNVGRHAVIIAVPDSER